MSILELKNAKTDQLVTTFNLDIGEVANSIKPAKSEIRLKKEIESQDKSSSIQVNILARK